MNNPYQYNNYRHSYTTDPNRPNVFNQQQQQPRPPTNSSAPPLYFYQPTPTRPTYGFRPYNYQPQNILATTPLSSPNSAAPDTTHGIRYIRNKDRQREINSSTTQFHCLDPVTLLNKSQLPPDQPNKKHRRLFPLYKVNEDWIAPNSSIRLENRTGYRCLLYVAKGTLLYDKELVSEGTLHLSTVRGHTSVLAKNPSRTHRTHVVRFWVDAQQDSTGSFPEANVEVRHLADSDMQNTLVAVLQPINYRATYGMTEHIYGPLLKEDAAKMKSSTALDSLYQLSQSTGELKRPDYFVPPDSMVFTPPAGDKEISVTADNWPGAVQEPGLAARVCADPFLIPEDLFIAVCRIDPGSRVVYQPFEQLSSHRQYSYGGYHRQSRRRVWVQTLLNDLSNEAVGNGGRLVVNGDMRNRMKPGGSAYIRKMDIQMNLVLENCGSAPVEFMLVEAAY